MKFIAEHERLFIVNSSIPMVVAFPRRIFAVRLLQSHTVAALNKTTTGTIYRDSLLDLHPMPSKPPKLFFPASSCRPSGTEEKLNEIKRWRIHFRSGAKQQSSNRFKHWGRQNVFRPNWNINSSIDRSPAIKSTGAGDNLLRSGRCRMSQASTLLLFGYKEALFVSLLQFYVQV